MENWTKFDKVIEIYNNQIYLCVSDDNLLSNKITSRKNSIHLCVDNELKYQGFANDFGPLNISALYKYCYKLNRILHDYKGRKKIVHCTSKKPENKVNSAFLIGSFSILYLRMTPLEIYRKLSPLEPFKQYVDALKYTNVRKTITLYDCLQAIAKASMVNFFDFSDFNVSEYDLFENMQFGNLNWILPRKFVAFAGPTAGTHNPEFYLEYFLQNDVKTVIRLNNKLYNASIFTANGIHHYDLFFNDGSPPPMDIVMKFFSIVESSPAAVAIHCKAGLGRTGTLICCYLIKHYGFTAKEAISWVRICRPGSVVGAQQEWLEDIESWLMEVGKDYRHIFYGDKDKFLRPKFGIYSVRWPIIRSKLGLSNIRLKVFGSSNKILRHKFGVYSNKWPVFKTKILLQTKKKNFRQRLLKGSPQY